MTINLLGGATASINATNAKNVSKTGLTIVSGYCYVAACVSIHPFGAGALTVSSSFSTGGWTSDKSATQSDCAVAIFHAIASSSDAGSGSITFNDARTDSDTGLWIYVFEIPDFSAVGQTGSAVDADGVTSFHQGTLSATLTGTPGTTSHTIMAALAGTFDSGMTADPGASGGLTEAFSSTIQAGTGSGNYGCAEIAYKTGGTSTVDAKFGTGIVGNGDDRFDALCAVEYTVGSAPVATTPALPQGWFTSMIGRR